ncbi:hypothetical protein [Rhizobium tumorigenes]|uniref:Uncharacterized protein n=1 Tax=Rhizobium tumorigenes TaxID=2041385 RepID=A0AAF1K3X6_9HYPH|nr:hypothetical protein [Rhizobium tumorigenes]WFR95011.1 hypothetical protein PR017_14550 [Rhizobium tumorigenes]
MAVLHHAFRCPVTPEFQRDVTLLLCALKADARDELSALAIAANRHLAHREDLHSAFMLHPDGSASSWMEPDFVSPGLAAVSLLAHRFTAIPGLSASGGANHYVLETHLPLLGWSSAEIGLLVRGKSIESMLMNYADTSRPIEQGGFRHTGGWTEGSIAQMLKLSIDRMIQGPPSGSDPHALAAWGLLNDVGALRDAQAMLAAISDKDWLVMSITH